MLVLQRRCREQVVLPSLDVVITVLEVKGDKVRLGITAPTAVEVHRQEVWLRIQQARSATPAAGQVGREDLVAVSR